MKKSRKSLVGFCVIYFSIYSCILLLSVIGINLLVESKLKMAMPSISDLLEYEDYLYNDDFGRIPLKDFNKNEILVFDEYKNIIFATNNFPEFSVSASELNFINDFSSEFYYTVKESVMDGDRKYYITKNSYDSDTEYENVVDYAVLNDKLEIIEGNLFWGRKKLTECELELINGYAGDNSLIEKYSYTNKYNKERTLVFLEAPFDYYLYEKKVNHIYSLWLYIIPIVAILELIITYMFYQRIKKMIAPLQELVEDYENVNNISDDRVSVEFKGLFNSFGQLINRLNNEKNKNDAIYKEKQSIIANISHDLKTPLTVIKGYAKALNDDMVPENKKEKYISAIYNKSEVATNIIDSLFEYTQMEHPDFKSNFEILDFNEFCREYLAMKYTDLELQGYKLEFELLNKELIKKFDTKLMTRLFDNIINNSIKHNCKEVTIYFKLIKKGENVKIIIADNGQGVSESVGKNIFKAFVTGDEARNNGSGTGLGLFIAKKIVDIHEGTIKLVSKPKSPYKFEIDIVI